ncbi:MAG: hypothetical protein CMJ83_16815 [Planctomycetes bacterium]|nr:hypothetical protein [Planctomycetota bacterium]
MTHLPLSTCVVLAIVALVPAQITAIPQASFVSPVVLDFETPPAGLITSMDPYFTNAGLDSVSIVNAPGLHTVGSDTLSSGFMGQALCSVGNTLAIVAPSGPMDDHTAGAGWSFRLASGTWATQFGCLVVDQINHLMAVETWCNGVMRDQFTFTMTSATGGFPNPFLAYEDLRGFDEVRFQNVTTAGGWGVDNFTLGNIQAGVCPPLDFQQNSANCSHDYNGAMGNGALPAQLSVNSGMVLTSTLTGVGQFWECAVALGPALGRSIQPPFLTTPTQVVNLDYPAIVFYLNGALIGAPLAPTPAAFPGNVSLAFVAPIVPSPITLTQQCIVFDIGSPDGFWLSQATELTLN